MSSRELIVLGSSSRVPTRTRNQGGYLLRWDQEGLLFDPGEGTQRQMIRAGVAASAITRILITHFHGDHCLGLPGVLQRLAIDGVRRVVDVYFPAGDRAYYERLREASIHAEPPSLAAHPVSRPGALPGGPRLAIDAHPLDHTVETWGYRIAEPEGRRLLPDRLEAAGLRGAAVGELVRRGSLELEGRRIGLEEMSEPRPGQSAAFVMDTRPCAGALELAQGVDLLVCESTYLEQDAARAREHGHMTAADAGRLASAAGARRLVLTHFSSRYRDLAPLLAEARAMHPDVVLAEDGVRVAVPRRTADRNEAPGGALPAPGLGGGPSSRRSS